MCEKFVLNRIVLLTMKHKDGLNTVCFQEGGIEKKGFHIFRSSVRKSETTFPKIKVVQCSIIAII
jgi:hypothetical protein